MRWVVFDYGEVISRRSGALPDLAAVLDVDPADFEAVYWAEREAYDRGCGDLPYWSAIGARLGVPVDEATADRLTDIDVRGWLHLEPSTMELLDELAAAEVPLALLSNASSTFGRAVERESWSARFEHLMFSGDLGTTKPDEAIWKALLDRLGADPADCVFLDDRQVNVDGAIAAGLDAVRWTGAAPARKWLAERGVLAG